MARKATKKIARKQYWIGYCRKSTDDPKKQQMSLPDQEKKIREHYHALSLEDKAGRPLKILPHEKRSAYKPNNRPVFNTMMKMADNGEVYGVLAAQSNRVSRNRQESGMFEQYLVDGRITYLDAVADNRRYSGQNSGDIFMLGIEGSNNWRDSKDKGTVIGQRMYERAKEGKHMGRKPFGFKPHLEIGKDGSEVRKTVVDEERLPWVYQIFHLAASGAYSLTKLEAWAQDKKRQIRMRPTKKCPEGKLLSRTDIANMLHDPYYKGYTPYKGDEHAWKPEHAPMDVPPINENLWKRAQQALTERSKSSARPKTETLRELFVCGSLIKCGRCGHVLSPERKLKKSNNKEYVYYSCKNPRTKCGICVPQETLLAQLREKIERLDLAHDAVEQIRHALLHSNQERMESDKAFRKTLNNEYESIKVTLGALFEQRSTAQKMGCAEILDSRINELTQRHNEVQHLLNATHDEGNQWIEQVIKCFELLKMAREVLTFGSWLTREAMLKAVASNYAWIDGNLVLDLRSPFREAALSSERPEWWSLRDSNS